MLSAISSGPPDVAASALSIWPDYPEALCNLGAALQGLGQHAESVEQLRRAARASAELCGGAQQPGDRAARAGPEGRGTRAISARAVELDPAFAPAQTNLGQMLLDRGRAEEALPHCQEAVRLDPNSAVLHHNLGNVLAGAGPAGRRQGFVSGSVAAESQAGARQCPPRPGHSARGAGVGRLVWLKKAVELEPDKADFWEWLAELYDEMEEPGESIPCWERVVALEPDRAGPHIFAGLGVAGGRAAGPRPRDIMRPRSDCSPSMAPPT